MNTAPLTPFWSESARRVIGTLFLLGVMSPVAHAEWQSKPFETPPADVLAEANARKDTPVRGVVRYLVDVHLRIDEAGRVIRTRREVKRLVGRSAIEAEGAMTVGWSGWHETRPTLEARVISRTGRARTLHPSAIAEGGGGRTDTVMFSDRKHLSAPLPGVGRQAVVETRTQVAEHRPRMKDGTWQVVQVAPGTAELRITVERPPGMHLDAALVDLPQAKAIDVNGVWRLHLESIPAPDPKAKTPLVPRVVLTTWPSWQAVAGAWHSVSGQHFNAKATPEVARLIDGLPRGGDPAQAAAAVAARIHREIRYTGIELGEAAYVPRAPDETLTRTYGDCKDLTVLAGAALTALGHRAHPVLVRAGHGPDVNPGAPGMAAFNHVILRVAGKRPIWIDMTARYLPVGQLPQGVAGRNGLVIDPRRGKLVTIPPAPIGQDVVRVTRRYLLEGLGAGDLELTTEADGQYGAMMRRIGDEPDGLDRVLARSAYAREGTETFEVLEAPAPAAAVAARSKVRFKGVRGAWIDEWTAAITVGGGSLVGFLPADVLADEDDEPLQFDHPQRIELKVEARRPVGFVLEGKPGKTTTRGAFGAGKWVRMVDRAADQITVTWSVDTGGARWTPKQRVQARKTLRKWLRTPLRVRFEHEAVALFDANKGRAALDRLRNLIQARPDDQAHQLRYVAALSERGYGMWARTLAERLLKTHPDDAHVATAAGWAVLHGELGRVLGSGSDRARAQAHFEAALKIEPEHVLARYGKALTLLHGDDGLLHGKGADLEAAVTALEALREVVPAERFALAQVGALTALGRHDAALKLAADFPDNQSMKVFLVYGRALTADGAAAVEFAEAHVPAESTRAEVLIAAARRLLKRRRYTAVKALAKAAQAIPQGAKPAKALLESVKHLTMRETLKFDPEDPTTPVRKVFLALFDPNMDAEAVMREHASPALVQRLLPKVDKIRRLTATTVPDAVAADSQKFLIDSIAGMPLVVEKGGDAFRGYAIRFGGDDKNGKGKKDELYNPITRAFVVGHRGKLRLIGLSSTPGVLGREVIRLLGRRRLAVARRWLDWLAPTQALWLPIDPFLLPAPLVGWARANHAGETNAMTAGALWLAQGDEIDQRDAQRILRDVVARRQTGKRQRVAATHVLIRQALREKRTDDALRLIAEATVRYSSSTTLLRWQIEALHLAGKSEAASRTARWGISRRQFRFGHSLLYLFLAERADEKGDLRTAFTEYGQAARQRFVSRTALQRMLWTAAALGNVDEAVVKAGDRLLARGNLTLDDRAALAAAAAERGWHTQALHHLRARGNVLDELDAVTWYLLGRMLLLDGAPEGARQAWQKAVAVHEAEVKASGDKAPPKLWASDAVTLARKELARTAPPTVTATADAG